MPRAAALACVWLAGVCACGDGDRAAAPPRVAVPAEEEAPAGDERTAGPHGARVVLLGSGTPVPDPKRAGPGLAVVVGDASYLVDLGAGLVRRAAAAAAAGEAALEPSRLTTAFVTHLHSDHTVGFADVWLTPAVVGRDTPLRVFGPAGLSRMAEHLRRAYADDLAARGALRGRPLSAGYELRATEVEPGVVYRDPRVQVRAFAVPHGVWKSAFGYRFDAAGRSIVISGDTAPSEAVVEACAGCDVLVHETYCSAAVKAGPADYRDYHASHHTSTAELAALAARARPRLLLLHHVLFFGCSPQQVLSEVRAGYDGEVVLGEDLGTY